MYWDDLKYLARLAETGSLSGAARRLGVEHATVARRIRGLEAALGSKLVDRRGGRYMLTAAGQQAVGHAQRMEQSALAVERIGKDATTAAPVDFSVTAPPAMASELIVPRLPAFLATHPDVRLSVIAASRYLSLTQREADVALRLSRPDASTLVVRRAGRLDYGLFAAKGYAKARGSAEHTFIGFEGEMAEVPQQLWLDGIAGSRAFAFRSNDLWLQRAAAKAGLGIASLPLFVGALEEELERVEPKLSMSRDVWLTYHRDLRTSPRLGSVTRFLLDCLRR